MTALLEFYTIIDHPADYPDNVVVASDETEPHAVDEARAAIPSGFDCIPRSEDDDPVLVESWLGEAEHSEVFAVRIRTSRRRRRAK